MKYAYNPKTGRYEWFSPDGTPDPLNNAGQPGIDNLGHPTVGVGGGVSIDVVNGGIVVGGIDLTSSN